MNNWQTVVVVECCTTQPLRFWDTTAVPRWFSKTLLIDSWVINLDSVTILWLVRFDAWFDFFGPFLKNLASMSLPKIPAIFSRGHNQRWPPTPFWKIKFGTRASITLYKYIFSINSITRISNQINLTFGFHFYTKFQDGRHPIVKKSKNSQIP